MFGVKSKILLCTTLLCSTLVLCGYTIRGASMVEMDVYEDYDNGFNTFNTIKLDGEYISLPCEVSVLKKLGFDFKTNDNIDPYSFDNMRYMYNKQGDRIMVDLVNLHDSVMTYEDCIIVEITYDYEDGSTLGFDYNGITFESTIEDCEAVLGRASYVSSIYDGVYTATFNSVKNERTAMLSFFKDDVLIGFSIGCDRPLDLGVSGYKPAEKYSDIIQSDGNGYVGDLSSETSETFAIFVILISVFVVIILPIVVIIAIIILVMRHVRKVKEAKYDNEIRKAREVRRVLQTPIEDIDVGLDDDDLKDKWLH